MAGSGAIAPTLTTDIRAMGTKKGGPWAAFDEKSNRLRRLRSRVLRDDEPHVQAPQDQREEGLPSVAEL